MTGILAGFAFTALVVLMTPTGSDGRKAGGRAGHSGVLMVLFSAFIALVMSTLVFTPLAAINISTPQGLADASTALVVYGLPISLAALMLFHGIALLMFDSGAPRHAVLTARIVAAVVLPTLSFAYLANGTVAEVWARPTNTPASCIDAAPPTFADLLNVLLPVVLALGLVRSLQPAGLRTWCRSHQYLVPIAVLSLSFGTAIFGSRIPQSDPGVLLNSAQLNTFIVAVFVVYFALGGLMTLGYAPLSDDVIAAPPASETQRREAPPTSGRPEEPHERS